LVFSSTVFLFAFLPAVLIVYSATPRALRNLWLLAASLLFYAWGETWFVLVMLASIAVNYLLGLGMGSFSQPRARRVLLAAGVASNVGLLGTYKYANFIVHNLNAILHGVGMGPVELAPIHLPIGISFFTFQALSYVIDVYRGDAPAQRNPLRLALYIALFPKVAQGPIVRYAHIADQLVKRTLKREDFVDGVRRFIIGLAKKVLIANTLGRPADRIFAIPAGELTPALAWLGAVCYTSQIYFDFAGYSDMAIGLGRMFGFHFLENFSYPYVSQSIREFWRRWHISLSSWFRDYVYIPLGGNRRSAARTHLNLFLVFFLCGLWHGASWTFVIWGMCHGIFMVLERSRIGDWLSRAWRPVRHAYALLVVTTGWVVFRAETLPQAWAMLRAMAGFAAGQGVRYHVWLYLTPEVMLALVIAVAGSAPLAPALTEWRARTIAAHQDAVGRALDIGTSFGMAGVFVLLLVVSAVWLSAGTYNPFIYFRF